MFKHFVTAVALAATLCASNYEDGDDAYENGDVKTAVSFWEKGAKSGEVESQFMLGLLYLRGDNIKKDTKRASSLLAKSFNYDNETLQITIAGSYYKNRAHKAEDILAVKQFEAAINDEGKEAQYNFGMMFVTGSGVDKDIKKGADFIKKAKNANHKKAQAAWKKYSLSKY